MSIADHKPMPEGEFVRAPGVEVFTGADPPILDGRREVGDCRGEFCVELERKPGSATARTNALAMFTWRREARLQSSEADNPGFVPAVVDRPDAVERPPVIEPDLGGDSVWIWRGAEPTRQRSPMSTRPTARRRSRSRTLPDSRASFRSTVTPDIGRWRARAASHTSWDGAATSASARLRESSRTSKRGSVEDCVCIFGGSGDCYARLLLGASAPPLLRTRRRRSLPDRERSAATHRRALSDRHFGARLSSKTTQLAITHSPARAEWCRLPARATVESPTASRLATLTSS